MKSVPRIGRNFVLVCVTLLIVAVFPLIYLWVFPPVPVGKQLLENYDNHRKEFNDLVKKIREDQLGGTFYMSDSLYRHYKPTSVSIRGVLPFTLNDREQYKEKLRKLGIKEEMRVDDKIDLMVQFYRLKDLIGDDFSYVGYLYTEGKLELIGYGDQVELVADIDEFEPDTRNYRVFQKIDENWYIYKGRL